MVTGTQRETHRKDLRREEWLELRCRHCGRVEKIINLKVRAYGALPVKNPNDKYFSFPEKNATYSVTKYLFSIFF